MLFDDVKKEKFLLVLMYILIFLRDMQIVNVSFGVFSALFLVGAIILTPSALSLYVICLVPFCRALPYSEMLVIALGAIAIKSVGKKRKLHNPILY